VTIHGCKLSDTTTTIRVLIADDEPLSRQLLRSLIEELDGIEVVAECRNGREAIERARELEPDLMVLDIQMPGTSGFDVVKELQADTMPNVVFCTAFQRYAVDAFDLHAVDYLLKPVDERRLQRAVARARQRISETAAAQDFKTPVVGAIEDIARKVAGRSDLRNPENSPEDALLADRKIAIRGHDGTVLVEIDDIDWVDAAGDYMCLHIKGETLIMRSTLKNLMGRLDQHKFKRVHRSTVVNLERIVKVASLQKGEYMLDLDCDQQVKVSRNYREAIKDFISTR
jgi:two-component system LytT family response regulator